MDATTKLTKQGVRDLNHYGPKKKTLEAGVIAVSGEAGEIASPAPVGEGPTLVSVATVTAPPAP
jgi:hypothetical protein